MKKIAKLISLLLAAAVTVMALCITAGAETPSVSKLCKLADSVDKKTYWVIFKEESRNNRIEMASFNGKKDFKVILWKKNLYCDKINGKANQYYYNESTGKFKYMNEWEHLSDNCNGIIASNVNIYDLDGNIIFKKNFTDSNPASILQLEMKKGMSVKLSCLLADLTESSAKWTSSKTSVAEVNSSGKVTAKGKGTAVISAEYGDKTLKIMVKVV